MRILTACRFRRLAIATVAALALHGGPAGAQAPLVAAPSANEVRVSWEVRNRFRLFRDEKDFDRHLAATSGRTILEAEQTLAQETDGRGWARDMVTRLCVDGAGRILDTCVRDGVRESYLAPVDHPVTVRLTGAVPPDASCTWSFDSGEAAPQTLAIGCGEEVNLRARVGRITAVTVDIMPPGGAPQRASAAIDVRDLLIAGLGDSIAAGEGDPDRPVALADDGFCFRTFIAAGGKAEYFRPGRVGFSGDKACDGGRDPGTNMAAWARLSARWMSSACHRSLYGYQLRAALGIAIENPHVAVTFLPLACTGATIDTGLFGAQRARELNCGGGNVSCPTSMPAQIEQLRDILARARRAQPGRGLDLIFLTIGANDVYFAGLVADVIIDATAERVLARRGGVIATVEEAQSALDRTLPAGFARLRAALKPLVGGRLDKVVFTTYGNPALDPAGGACPGGRDGFDVQPAFTANGERLRKAELFVQNRFLPAIKALATCTGGAACGSGDAMSFADAHQAAFAQHGLCARADTDPEFDRACFSPDGKSFTDNLVDGATDPMACDLPASDFRAYASRARWIRTANDSYFAAMTFPEGVSSMTPADLHDATWGILSAVYGGAIHPTAEGYAAMADSALATARQVLGLGPAAEPITEAPLAPLAPTAPPSPAPNGPPAAVPPADVPYTPPPPPPR